MCSGSDGGSSWSTQAGIAVATEIAAQVHRYV